MDATPSSPHRRLVLWIAAAAGVLLVVCVALGVLGFRFFQQADAETTAALAVVDQFLQAGMRHDPAAGWALCTGGGEITREGVARLFSERRELFEGYQSLRRESWRVTTTTAGVRATLSGATSYEAKPERRFTATLVVIAGQWRLVSLRFVESIGLAATA